MADDKNKKVFLLNFSTPLLRDVALELKKQSVSIVYWTGCRPYFKSFSQDRQNFPTTIFHDYFDAIKGIPAQEFEHISFPPPSKELINKLLKCESQVLIIMKKADFSNIHTSKKRHFYYNYVKYWHGVLTKLQPDAILIPEPPHRIYDNVIYTLAKDMGIKIVYLNTTRINKLIVVSDHKESSRKIMSELAENEDKKIEINNLSPKVLNYYKKQLDSNYDSTPP